MIDFAADLAEMIDTQEFASTCHHAGHTFPGIFDRDYVETLETEARVPQVLVRSADVPTIAQGQTIVVGTTAYTVRNVQPDGTGATRVLLEEV